MQISKLHSQGPRYKMATEKSFPKCHLGYSILGSCIQSKLIVIDECEQRRPAQDLPNPTQLTLSGRRVFRRYSFLGTPPPQFLIFLCQTDSLNMNLYRRKISSFHSCHVGQVITNSLDSCLSILSWLRQLQSNTACPSATNW